MIRPSPALHGFMPDNAYGTMQVGSSNPIYGNIGVQPGLQCAAGSYGMLGANMGMAGFSQPYAQNLNMIGRASGNSDICTSNITNTFEVDVMIAWNQLSAINCESLEEYNAKFWDALLPVNIFKIVPLAEQIEKYCCGLPKGIKKYCTKTSVMNMAQLMENVEVADDLIRGKPDEDKFKTRCKVPQGKQFSAKGNATSKLTVPPFKKKPFADRRQGSKRHFIGKTIDERNALRDAKKCYICEEGHFANESPQRNSQDKDDKSDRKGKKPKSSAGLVPDLAGDQQNMDATELCRAWGKVRNQEVLVFFDSGAPANFISPKLSWKSVQKRWGSLEDRESLVAAMKQVDVVISAVRSNSPLDELTIIEAIKEVGTIKRFFPSEFGNDADRVHALEPLMTHVFGPKAQIRRTVEKSGIPYTFVVSNGFAGYFLSNLLQHGLQAPPRDKVSIYGSGDVNFIMVLEEDVGAYTMKAVDDPRTLNKILHIRPLANIVSMNSLVEMWEMMIGKILEKVKLTEEDMASQMQETPFPDNLVPAILHDIAIRGDQCNFDLGPKDVEATRLYPDHKYTTVKEYLARFL
ncbi:hypothetical protein L7F22_034282 [Adiantum nelumboides]|nr:hypothetical protein [Adiantum nelumboides]